MTTTKLPPAFKALPEVPSNGNYVCMVLHYWGTGETLSEAVRNCRDAGGSPGKTQTMVLDVSDDYSICHVTGSVSASKLAEVFKG